MTVNQTFASSVRNIERKRNSLLPKGNINKSVSYIERKLKENNIGRSNLILNTNLIGESLKVTKERRGALFKSSKSLCVVI